MLTDLPVVLDLFCGRTGGAAAGYQRAGFWVVGVDIEPCPDYPARAYLGDALELLPSLVRKWRPALVHASPPCQGIGTLAQGTMPELAVRHPDMISKTREALERTRLPYVIENVPGSKIRRDVLLCGEMFGLGVIMHRVFELGRWSTKAPVHQKHRGWVRGWRHGVWRDGPYVAAYGRGGGKATVAEMRLAKGIDWSSDHLGLRDALPPAYTDFIGTAFLASPRMWQDTWL